MSGIAGVLRCDGAPALRETLDAMVAASTPFVGPRGVGDHLSGPLGLLRFHAATTPEAISETQPWVDPRSGCVITFDGRIDNRGDLLTRLGRSVHAPDPDCAIVAALWGELGEAALDHLVGDYAFAVWNPHRRHLVCARSPLGWRTLLWTADDRRFAFASQPRTLVEGLALERRLNEGAIGEYLSARFVTQRETFWQGVERLPGGGAITVKDGQVRRWHWFRGPFEDLTGVSEAEHVERFRELFDTALVASTRGNGPVAAHLSGGLDSSSVVCRATQLARAGLIDRQPVALSVRYPGAPHDETRWSKMVEHELGITAEAVAPDTFGLEQQRQFCADTYHLPLRPNVMTATVAHMRGRGLDVVLTGEGGDDWLAGGRSHWPDLLVSGRWARLLSEAVRGQMHRLPIALGGMAKSSIGPLVSRRLRAQMLRPHLDYSFEPPPWIRSDWARRTGLSDRWRSDALPVELPRLAEQQRYQVYAFSRRHINWDNVLAYLDMNGIEARHPLHDLRLTRFLMGADGGLLKRGTSRKHLLRESMRGVLPEDIRTRRDKANFVTMTVASALDRLSEKPLEHHHCVAAGWIDPAPLVEARDQFAAWRAAGSPTDRVPDAPFNSVWFALALDLWLENAFGL